MADITITAANVVSGSGAVVEHGTAGASITAGQAVYLDSSDLKYKLCDCDSATLGIRTLRGVALHAASNGQPLSVQTKGPITIGGTCAAGVVYCVSDTAGGIRPVSDQGTGDYTQVVGIGTSTSVIDIQIHNSHAQVA